MSDSISGCPSTHPRCQHTRETDYLKLGCRCAAARQDRERRRKQGHLLPPRLIDATGSRRRLQALMAIGWPSRELALRIGRDGGSLGTLTWGQTHPRITTKQAAAIAQLYDEIWDQAGPSEETRRRSIDKGWAPPLYWTDEEIDDPAFVPDYQPYEPPRPAKRWADRSTTITKLTQQGLSASVIAERVEVSARTVVRARARLRDSGQLRVAS